MRVDPAERPPLAARYRDGTYLARNPGWHEEDAAFKAAHVIALLDAHGIEPQSIGEVGCGTGEVLRLLADRYGPETRCVGYEMSPHALSFAEAKSRRNLGFHGEDPLARNDLRFDVALALDVVEHVEDCFGFLRQLAQLAPRIVLHIPLDLSAQAVLRGGPLMEARRRVGHLHYFTKDTALAMLDETGYAVLEHRYTCGGMELGRSGWTGLRRRLLWLPRRVLHAVAPDLAARFLGGFSLLVLARPR